MIYKTIYRPIQGFNNRYLISNNGELFSSLSKRNLIPCINKFGYVESVLVYENGKRKNFKWHRLVAQAFIPNPNGKKYINHINGIKTDNRVENLEWCTEKENINHAIKVLNIHIGPPKGILPKQLKYRLKFTQEQIKDIKKRLKNGEQGKLLSKEYKVSDQTIYDIKNGRCWK